MVTEQSVDNKTIIVSKTRHNTKSTRVISQWASALRKHQIECAYSYLELYSVSV